MSRRPYDEGPYPWTPDRDFHRYTGRGPVSTVRGRPIDLEWAGWRSDTHTLQRHGWEFAESRNCNPYTLGEDWELQMRHPGLGVAGMTGRQCIPTRQRMMHDWEHGNAPIHLHVDIGMPYMIQEHMSPIRMEESFIGVDTRPYYTEVRSPYNLYHMPYFRPIGNSKEIFLKEASVAEIMQIALDKQEPEQAEIRARQRQERDRAEYRRGGEEKARLIMVA